MTVVDSSVLILLSRIDRLSLLKRYFGKAAITPDIYDEIKKGLGANEIEKACEEWIKIEKPNDSKDIENISKLEGIEKADASIIVLAKERQYILLSNDYALIMVARSKGIESWWLTTFLLRCLKKKIIAKNETKRILLNLIEAGMRLDNVVYAAILKEIDDI